MDGVVQHQLATGEDESVVSSASSIPRTSFIHGTEATDDEEFEDESAVPKEAPTRGDGDKEASGSPRKYKARYEPQGPPSGEMSEADVGIFQMLDAEYDRAMEEREVSYAARYQSVRQSACFAVGFMVIYMTLGTVYFMRQAGWTMEESLFYGIYTITTVGCKFAGFFCRPRCFSELIL